MREGVQGQDPSWGTALATKFDNYTVFTHIAVNLSMRTGCDQNGGIS
jgi:hypothetical protein